MRWYKKSVKIILYGMFELYKKRIHFIGIGGVGVNALAKFCGDFGAKVSGSDIKINSLCEDIVLRGGEVWQGENADRMADATLVVYSSAIKPTNAELIYAIQHGIKTLERYEFLGMISSLFKKTIAIAGTHGKTTTTAMLTHILKKRGVSFVSMIGGECVDFSNYVNNINGDLKDAIFLCEACEYKHSLLALYPEIAVVTNAECDHPDCYKNLDSVNDVFEKFFSQSNTRITSGKYSYLLKADGYADDSVVVSDGEGTRAYSCDFERDTNGICGIRYADGILRLKDDGDYNYLNAMYAILVAEILGIRDIEKCLEDFNGVKRRFEEGKRIADTRVFFDFAHHPTEIRCVLNRAKRYGKMLVVFQPHTYSRTKAYLDDFVDVFSMPCIDALVLMPTYSAREDKSQGVDSDILVDAIFDKNCKKQVYLAKSAQSTLDYIKNNAKLYDVIMFVGAGDIYALKDKY